MLSVLAISVSLWTSINAQKCDIDTGADSTYTETIEDYAHAHLGKVRRITASGCPNYPSATSFNPNDAIHQDWDISLAAYPCFSDSDPYDLSCVGGAVAITLNGISIFSKYECVRLNVHDYE